MMVNYVLNVQIQIIIIGIQDHLMNQIDVNNVLNFKMMYVQIFVITDGFIHNYQNVLIFKWMKIQYV